MASEAQKRATEKYRKSEKGKAALARAQAKYRATHKGQAATKLSRQAYILKRSEEREWEAEKRVAQRLLSMQKDVSDYGRDEPPRFVSWWGSMSPEEKGEWLRRCRDERPKLYHWMIELLAGDL